MQSGKIYGIEWQEIKKNIDNLMKKSKKTRNKVEEILKAIEKLSNNKFFISLNPTFNIDNDQIHGSEKSLINAGTQNITNSIVNFEEIAEDVRINIGKLESTSNPKVKGIKELLDELYLGIDNSDELDRSKKSVALKQMNELINAWNNPKKIERQNLAKNALMSIRNYVSIIPALDELCRNISKYIDEN